MKFVSPFIALLLFLIPFSTKAVAFPGVDDNKSEKPLSQKTDQHSRIDDGDDGSNAGNDSSLQQRGTLGEIKEDEDNSVALLESGSSSNHMEIHDQNSAPSFNGLPSSSAVTEERVAVPSSTGSDGQHHIEETIPERSHPTSNQNLSEVTSSAARSISVVPDKMITPETLLLLCHSIHP